MREAVLPMRERLPAYLVVGLFLAIIAACAGWGAVQYLNDRNQLAAYQLSGFCISVATVLYVLFNRPAVWAQCRLVGITGRLGLITAAAVPGFVALNYLYTNLLIGGVFGDYFTVASDSAAIRQQLKWILLVAVLPAVIEEVAFRGIVLDQLAKVVSPQTAIGFSAILFGVSHFGLMSIPYLFLLGLFLGWLRWRSGGLLLPIAAHLAHNLLVLWWM